MEKEQQAIQKLIILAILGRANGLTVNQLTALALETLYLDYFDFVHAYEELVCDHLTTESVRKGETMTDAAGQPVTRCDITPQGMTILETLENRIPLPVRSFITSTLAGWRKDQLRESTVTATFDPDANGFYQVRLKQHDGRKETVDLRLTVPNEAIARKMCENWRQFPQTLYMGLLTLLSDTPVSGMPMPEKRQEPQSSPGNSPSENHGFSALDDRQLNLPVDEYAE